MTSAISSNAVTAYVKPTETVNSFRKEVALVKRRHAKRGLLYDFAFPCDNTCAWEGADCPATSNSHQGGGNGSTRSGSTSTSYQHLPEAAERARRMGNRAIFEEDWPAAVQALTDAISLAPWCLGLYTKRAEAYLGRASTGGFILEFLINSLNVNDCFGIF
jgi:hypothetical protein